MCFKINSHTSDPIYHQLAAYIVNEIRNNRIKIGERLLSVNEAYRVYSVSRDTVLAAYGILKEMGVIVSVPGKGFFVERSGVSGSFRLFMVFDAMNQYKETLYRSLVDHLAGDYEISISFHYYDVALFDTLVSNACGKYDYYVLIPHFNRDVSSILDKIPSDQLLLLDAFPEGYSKNCAAVYQRFYSDSYEGLKSILDKLMRYEALHIVYNDQFQYMPEDYIAGVYRFSGEFRFPVYVERDFNMETIQSGHCYMAISERDLASIIKQINRKGFQVGKDIGLLSLDDTPLKEVLIGGITTLTTDFELMGRTAAELINRREQQRIANPWRLILRGSL